jgi:hypothetical protein
MLLRQGKLELSFTISPRINGRVFCIDALENVLVFLAVKAAQGIPAQDIHIEGCRYFVPELFKPNRGVGLTFGQQER